MLTVTKTKETTKSLGSLFFDGIPVVPARGAADGTIIAAEKSNLFFGTGLLNDLNEVRVIDMAENDGSQNMSCSNEIYCWRGNMHKLLTSFTEKLYNN